MPQIKDFLNQMQKSCLQIKDDEVTSQLIQQIYQLENTLISPSLQHIKFQTGLEKEGMELEARIMQIMIEKNYLETAVSPEEVYYEINQ